MAKILVSLVSNETIPNIQLIKELKDIDKYIFISTSQMQNQLKWIIETVNIPLKKIKISEVNPFSISDIQNKLKKILDGNNEYLVNVTGGTKMMSITCMEFFRNYNAKIYYISGKNNEYTTIFPFLKKPNIQFNTSISLLEYLSACGISLKNTKQNLDTTTKDIEYTNNFFDSFTSFSDEEKQIISKLRDLQNDDKLKKEKKEKIINGWLNVKSILGLSELLNKIIFPFEKEDHLSSREIDYLIGGWLEEYVFLYLKQYIDKEKLFLNPELLKKDTDKAPNEFDILMYNDNVLSIFECKTSHHIPEKSIENDKDGNLMTDKEGKPIIKIKPVSKLTDYIYKLDSLKNEFGLFATAYLFTLGNLPKDEKELDKIKDRAKLHKIKLINTKQEFQDIVSKLFNLKTNT